MSARLTAITQALKATAFILLAIASALVTFYVLYITIVEVITYKDRQNACYEEFFSAQGSQDEISEEECGMRYYDAEPNLNEDTPSESMDSISCAWS